MRNVSCDLESLPAPIKERIKNALDEVLPQVEKVMDVRDVQIVFNTNQEQTIEETGVGGFTESPYLMIVSIDVKHENVIKNVEEEVKGTVAHELHHCIRNRTHPWPGTLLDDIIAEGLADHFDIEINGNRPKPWTDSLSDVELSEYRKLAEPSFFKLNSEEDYFRWVLGFGDDAIPPWAGYALGFSIVGDYLKRTGKKPSQLVSLASEEFIK